MFGRWGERALVLSAVLLAACGETPPEPVRRSVVLVTVDTLRADHLGSYGYPREVSPFLDRLAATGVRYTNAVSSCSHTAPSHASILTSLQPFQHGLVKNGQGLRAELLSLPEVLGEYGYESAAFTSVGFLAELEQGFGTFRAQWQSGDLTVDQALQWFEGRSDPDAPFFLWVHLYDPHRQKGERPKLAADAEALAHRTPAEAEAFVEYLRETRGLDPDFYSTTERLLQRYDLYDAGIRYADREIERLHRTLEASSPGALWIVTSDHGEGLGNHGYDDHGKYLYREQLRVPLILDGPGLGSGESDRVVRLVDLFPTVLDWVGIERDRQPTAIEGYSLLEEGGSARSLPSRLAFGQRRPKDDARHRQSWADGEVYSLETATHKLILNGTEPDELYDLVADPWELDNRAGTGSDLEAQLRKRLLSFLETGAAAPAGEAESNTEHDEELRSLGYL